MKQALQWLGFAASTFAGGAGGWAATQLEDHVPSTSAQWKAIGIGAVIAGVAALLKSPLGSAS